MNARSIVSRVFVGLLTVATLVLAGCTSGPDIITPRGGGTYGGHYDYRAGNPSAGVTIYMPMGAGGVSGSGSAGGVATAAMANARVVTAELLATREALRLFCNTPTVALRMIADREVIGGLLPADQARLADPRPAIGRATSNWRCPEYVEQHARLLRQLRPALDVANQATGSCSYTLSERTGQPTARTRDCQASGLENWRGK